jgi:hypothetical protein
MACPTDIFDKVDRRRRENRTMCGQDQIGAIPHSRPSKTPITSNRKG